MACPTISTTGTALAKHPNHSRPQLSAIEPGFTRKLCWLNLISMMISISYYYPCSYPLIVPITQHNLPRYPYHPMMRVDDPFERFVEPSIFIHYHPMWHHGGYYYPILSNIIYYLSNLIQY